MYSDPATSETFKKKFAINSFAVVLEPGQVHEHWVEGDVGDYDFSKFSETTDGAFKFNNYGPCDRHIFFTSVPELSSSATVAGRLRTDNALDQIVFETQIFCRISMPETAGFVTLAQGGTGLLPQPLTQRKRAYFLDNFWATETTAAFTNTVDDNYPVRQGQ